MVSFDSFKIDLATDQWHLIREEPPNNRIWMNPKRSLLQQRLILVPPNDLPADYPNIESQRAFYKGMNWPMTAVDSLLIHGVEGFSTLLKVRIEQGRDAYRVLGVMMFTWESFFCGFHFQADELGMTGQREVMASILSGQKFFGPYTDDEEYDAMLPDHPLSLVRRYMKHMAATIDFDDELKRAKPFRGPDWKPAQ